MCVKMPAAIISGVITMIMLAIVVPWAINASEPCVTHAPSFAPKRLAALNESTPAWSKK